MRTACDGTANDRVAALLAHADIADPWVAFRLARYVLAANVISGIVLDLGCEFGIGARLLSRSTTPVIAADLRAQHLAVARTLLAGSGAVAVQADGRRLPFAAAAMDGVCVFNVLSLAERPEELLAECWRVLRPEGLIVLSDARRRGGERQPDPAALCPDSEGAWRVVGMHLQDGRVRFATAAAGDPWWVAFGSSDLGRIDEIHRMVDGMTFDLAETIGEDRRNHPSVPCSSILRTYNTNTSADRG